MKARLTTAERRATWEAQGRLPHTQDKLHRQMVSYNVERFHDYKATGIFGAACKFDTGGDDYSGQSKPSTGLDIRLGLALRGWTEQETETGTTMVHPDGQVRVRFEPHGEKSERSYFERVIAPGEHRVACGQFMPVKTQTGCATCGYAKGHHPK